MEKKHYERPHIVRLDAGMPSKAGIRSEQLPTTHIDGIAVTELIEKYGSPLFVLSEKTIRSVYQKAYKAFSTRYPKVQFAWSYKTNYLSAVCNIFHQEIGRAHV